MKKYILVLFFLPLMSYGQQCSTLVPNNNFADSVVFCVDSVSCFGGSDGRIVISVHPQINNFYRYNWDNTIPQLGLNIIDSLVSGTPGVAITDTNNNFIIYIDIPIYEPSPINNFVVFENPTCFDSSNGSLSIITNGGTSPFSYNWSNGSTATGLTTELNNLSGGQYTLITIDNNLCSDTTTYTLIEPNQVNSTTITDTLTCIGDCDGTGIVTPYDGVAPYTYLWSNGDTDSTATGLCYGTNTVTIADVNGCIAINTVTIANPDTLKLSNITIDSACYQICDGELSVIIEGGISPYDIEWSLGGNIFDTINTTTEDTLCPGNYQIKFTDANLCVDSIIIPLIERDSFVVQDWIIDDSCYNSCTGQITVQLLNPENLPIIYSWSNGGEDTVISNLCSDTFELVIIDNRLCSDTFDFFVEPGDSMYFDSIAVTNNSCYGDEEGAISLINFNGGIEPIDYIWSNADTTPEINLLTSGLYNVAITDANGCSLDSLPSNIVVSQPDSLYAVKSKEDVSCFGGADGFIDIDIYGGTGGFIISWDISILDTNYLDSLPAGQYIYTIVDTGTTCPPLLETIVIDEPVELVLTDSIVDVLCKGDATGEIHLEVEGGESPYQYSIDNGDNFQSQAYFENLIAGSYSIIVKDANDCEITSNLLDISEPLTVLSGGLTPPNLLCFGDTGTVVLTVSGGTLPYTYDWGNGVTAQDLNGVAAANYSVTILDANDCELVENINVTSTDEINVSEVITDLSCFEDGTGVIDISITGGATPFALSWSNGETTSNINGLDADTYTLNLTDNNGCTDSFSFDVEQPDLLELTSIVSHVACFGESNGEIDITVTGGTSPYNFDWSNLTSSEDLQNVPLGSYDIAVTDANSCLIPLTTIAVNEPTDMTYTITTIDLVCNNIDEGEISISVSGGTPAYSYSIDGGATYQSSNNFYDLQSNNYDVVIQDASLCQKQETVILNQPIGYSTSVIITDVEGCNGESTGVIDFTLSGNSPPYTYNWSNNESSSSIYNIPAGNYDVIVSDANNCEMTYSYLVTEPNALNLQYDILLASCEEKNDGGITTVVTGGALPYSYLWGNEETSSDLFNIEKGTYSLYLEDSKGCSLPIEVIEVGFDGFNGCIEIPSGFTPNNDNIHDEWVIYGLNDFPDVIVKIYNRWGQELFSSSGYSMPWDGKYNGVDLPTATYYYVIELNESDKVFNGTVTIKR